MKKFIDSMMQGTISDVVISGFTDSDGPLIFHPMYERMYFTLSDCMYELYIDDDGVIRAKVIENIKKWFEIDEDDRFALISIYSQLFKTEQEIKISKIDYQITPFSTMNIHYEDGDNKRTLIVDPNNFFGFTFL